MGEDSRSTYQVCTREDIVFVKVIGRASYMNCDPFRRFLDNMLEGGKRKIVFDFSECAGLDSTFLGILVSAALVIRGLKEEGFMTLSRLVDRNLETVRNLGIHRIADVQTHETEFKDKEFENVSDRSSEKAVDSKEIYKAHKILSELNEGNAHKFRDVVSFLELQKEEGNLPDPHLDMAQ